MRTTRREDADEATGAGSSQRAPRRAAGVADAGQQPGAPQVAKHAQLVEEQDAVAGEGQVRAARRVGSERRRGRRGRSGAHGVWRSRGGAARDGAARCTAGAGGGAGALRARGRDQIEWARAHAFARFVGAAARLEDGISPDPTLPTAPRTVRRRGDAAAPYLHTHTPAPARGARSTRSKRPVKAMARAAPPPNIARLLRENDRRRDAVDYACAMTLGARACGRGRGCGGRWLRAPRRGGAHRRDPARRPLPPAAAALAPRRRRHERVARARR
jgi:hypothetical protein